jgi:hypothetical protein
MGDFWVITSNNMVHQGNQLTMVGSFKFKVAPVGTEMEMFHSCQQLLTEN